jgi:hypothetical protein
MSKSVSGVLLLAAALLAAAVIGMETVGKGLSISEMDWNGNGGTSVGEFFDTMNVGVYRTRVQGRECRQVYATKDCAPLKELCP